MNAGDLAKAIVGEHETLGAYCLVPKAVNGTINKRGVVTVKIETSFAAESDDLRTELKGKWIVVQVVDKP